MLIAAGTFLPYELRELRQWAVASPVTKAPMSVGQTGFLELLDVNDANRFMTFAQAAEIAERNSLAVGFVLTASDPFTCIDLDVKDAGTHPEEPHLWTTDEQFARYGKIISAADSYTEMSLRGKGVHVWVRGKIAGGMRRDGVEVYSNQRFIICTGKVVHNVPVQTRQELLDQLVQEMRGKSYESVPLQEIEPEYSDSQIMEFAMRAANAEKFNSLCAGNWQSWNFPSQSEADLALMSMFAYYSCSNEQCRRLFRATALGRRDKATRNDRYLNYTLRIIRNRQAQENISEASAVELAAQVAAEMERDLRKTQGALHATGRGDDIATSIPLTNVLANLTPTPESVAKQKDGIAWPPGLTGQIASFIYDTAPRPVKEIAIVAALGLMAGMCGKAYHIPQSGLNLYLILVARSAIGKEALHTGISTLIATASHTQPAIMQFVDFSDFASGPALVKAVAKSPSFVNISGEWGRKLQRMAAADGRDAAISGLRTVMTNLYQKSGPQSIVGGITYSNKEDTIASVGGVSYSMVGETTPDTFYECLSESMMEDGFLSRFTVVEYNGERPPLNKNPLRQPPDTLVRALQSLAVHCVSAIDRFEQGYLVGRTDAAAQVLATFEQECDQQINGSSDESWRQMWNRASLKVMRIAALLAIGDNYTHPIIDLPHVNWALDLIKRDISTMSERIANGDVGGGDTARDRKLIHLLREYLTTGAKDGYGVSKKAQAAKIIPRRFIGQRLARISAFNKHRLGMTAAVNLAIQNAIDNGILAEVDRTSVHEKYSETGKCYRIINLPPQENYKSD